MSRLFAQAIEGLVFEPPKFLGYLEKDAVYVKTIDGTRITTMILLCDQDHFDSLSTRPRDLVLYSHGNAKDIGNC